MAGNKQQQSNSEGQQTNETMRENAGTQVTIVLVRFWEVTRHQYGISAHVSQTSLGSLRSNDADDNENVKKKQ